MADLPDEIVVPRAEFLDYIAAATLGRQVLEVIGMKLETAHDAAANMAGAERRLMRAMDRAVLAAEEADRG